MFLKAYSNSSITAFRTPIVKGSFISYARCFCHVWQATPQPPDDFECSQGYICNNHTHVCTCVWIFMYFYDTCTWLPTVWYRKKTSWELSGNSGHSACVIWNSCSYAVKDLQALIILGNLIPIYEPFKLGGGGWGWGGTFLYGDRTY